MEPQFSSLDDGTGLEVIDPIEGVRVVIPTSEEVSPVEAASDGFAQPVSTACKITASEFRVNGNCAVTLNDVTDGSVIESISYLAERTLPSDKYLFGIATKLTLYIDVTSEISVDGNSNQIRFEFENSTDIRIGARSLHRKPAGTITVPDDPRALMQAVSAFGSALKTTSPERSWSTLRGHPPRIERGETLDIPANISIPKTGVSIHVPPDYEHIYPVVPLAYYLGAKVVSGDPPRLTTESGFVHRLDTDRGFETEVARILKQVFLFDLSLIHI